MKLFVGVVIGILLGVSTAGAASTVYWKRGGQTYMCEGISASVVCKETNWKPAYAVHIVPGSIIVSYSGKAIYGCDRKTKPAYNCQSFVPGP